MTKRRNAPVAGWVPEETAGGMGTWYRVLSPLPASTERVRGGQRWYQALMETSMSLDLLTQYIDHALTFERMADAEPNQGFKADLERQASRAARQKARLAFAQ
jgi:hypothetical protein